MKFKENEVWNYSPGVGFNKLMEGWKMLHRRAFSFILMCFVFVTLVSAVAWNQDRVTLNIACDGGANIAPFEWMKDQIEAELPVNIVLHSLPFEEVYSKLKTEFVAETGAYDIVVFFPKMLGDFVINDYLLPLDVFNNKLSVKTEDVVLPVLEFYCKADNKLYALPYDGDVLAMWYRKDLFENLEEQAAFEEKYGYELQPPETWNQWLDIAEFFTRKKGEVLAGEVLKEDFYGCATYGQRDFMYAWWFNRYASMGGSYFDKDLNPLINAPGAIQALENWIASLQYSPPEVLTYGFDELQAAFISGRCAMEINWTDVGRVGSNPTVSQVVGKIGVGLVPGTQLPDGNILHRPVLAGGRVMAITKTCKTPDLAFEVLRMMALDASLAYVSSSYAGMDPFRISHFETPEAFGMFASYEEAEEYLDGVRSNIEVGYPELTMQGSAQYMDILSLALSQALAKQKTPKEALDWAASEWNKITDSLGRDIQKQYYRSLIQSWKDNEYWFD